jgi:hypothetical protein
MNRKLKLKKGISQTEAIRSARKEWGFKPTSRVVESKRGYDRKKKDWKHE